MASDEQIRITVERVLTGLRGPLEEALRADGGQALEEVRRQAEEQLAQLRADARRENDDLRTSAETQISELKRMLDDIRHTAEQQIDTARRTLETEVAGVRARATAEVEEVKRTADDRLRAVTRELDAARLQLDAARSDAEAARKDAARTGKPETLAGDLRLLDEATSLSDVLERLTQAAARHAGRAALLVVRNDRLRRWQTAGFGGHQPVEAIDVPLDQAGIAADALRDRSGATHAAGEPGRLPAFAAGADSRDAAALPVMVAGAVVAVLYADAPGGGADPRRWQDDLDVLARYTSRVLETITVQQVTGVRAIQAVGRPSQPADARLRSGGLP